MISPSDPQSSATAHPAAATPAVIKHSPNSSGSEDENPLIPVRMLNEFTYCPRLGYLEWVQGEWAENIETMEGSFGHRNVDKPDRKSIPARKKSNDNGDRDDVQRDSANGDSIHARSITLSSDADGIVAKLDLLELDGAVATPVDYKRGQVPNNPEQSWEPERVQLCAQGLVLRANGFESSQGVLYYIASKRRVVIPFDDALVARTRELIVQFKQAAAEEQIPPPLEDSPKCPRCSLVGICLPDETNLLRAPEESAPDGNRVRKLLPAKSKALPLYIQHQGAFVGKSGDRVTIKLKGEELASVRLLDVSQVCAYGNVMFSGAVIAELNRRSIPIVHKSYGGWFHGITMGLSHKNVELRIRQFRTADAPEAALTISRQFIAGKIKNCRTLLRRQLGSKDDPVIANLAEYRKRALRADSAETLLGLEGMAAKCYFEKFFPLISGIEHYDVDGRNRRPPRDPVNAVLSFVYSLLTKELTVTLNSVGFDPMLGFLHRPRYGRPSLALDLAEEFRPLIADSVTLMAFNNGEINADSFLARAGAVALTDAGRKSVIAAFERRMDTEITHPIFGYKVSYRRILEVQARLLARYLLGEIEEYPGFVTR